MELTMHMSGEGPFPASKDLAHWTISAYFEAPHEAMTFTVVVPHQGGEDAMRAQAISRARNWPVNFARQRRLKAIHLNIEKPMSKLMIGTNPLLYFLLKSVIKFC